MKTLIICVPTLWREGDLEEMDIDPNTQKETLDDALNKGYRVKIMNNYEYENILFSQYVLEKRKL